MMSDQGSGVQSKSPTELLQEQSRYLGEICRTQQEQIGLLKEQNRQLVRVLETLDEHVGDASPVNVENVNMPFGALVGFLVKLSLASIPAGIVMAVLSIGLFLLLTMLGVFSGALLGGLR
jgi:hypothetical protein